MDMESADDDGPSCKSKTSDIETEEELKVEKVSPSAQQKNHTENADSKSHDDDVKTDEPVSERSTTEDDLIYMGLKRGNVLRSRITDEEIENLIVKCTACGEQINHHNPSHVRRHLHLSVLICRECFDFYDSGEFSQDETGDIYCRWCAQGGKLIACDFCLNAFCYDCVRRNFGRGEVRLIQDVKWHCYMCNQKYLSGLVAYCTMILEYSQKKSHKKNEKLTSKSNNEKLLSINDFDDADKIIWVNQRIDDVLEIASSLKKKVKSSKEDMNENNIELTLRCNRLLEKIVNNHIRQLKNVLEGVKKTRGRKKKTQNSHNDISVEKQNCAENGVENSSSEDSSNSDIPDNEKDDDDNDYSIKSTEFRSESSDANGSDADESAVNSPELETKTVKKSKDDESPKLSPSLLSEISSFPNKLNEENNNSEIIEKLKTSTVKEETKTDENIFSEDDYKLFSDNDGNGIDDLNNSFFNLPESVLLSEDSANEKSNKQLAIFDMTDNKTKSDYDKENLEMKENTNVSVANNFSDIINNSDKLNTSYSKCEKQDHSSSTHKKQRSTVSQKSVKITKSKKMEPQNKKKKEKTENEKAKEILLKLANNSSDSETEHNNLSTLKIKDTYNSDLSTEEMLSSTSSISGSSSSEADSESSNFLEEIVKSPHSNQDQKLQMDVKVCVKKVDDRTLDDSIEDLPIDEEKTENKDDKDDKLEIKKELVESIKSEDSEEELDKEIDRLAILPTVKKKHKLNSDPYESDEEEKADSESQENKKKEHKKKDSNKKEIQKIKSKALISSDSDSGDLSADKSTSKSSDRKFQKDVFKIKSQNEVAKDLLLKDTLSSSEEEELPSSDSIDDIFRKDEKIDKEPRHAKSDKDEDYKPEKHKKNSKTDSDDSIDAFLSKKIKRTYHKLLAIPLSDDDSKEKEPRKVDDERKKKSIKRKILSSDEENKKSKKETTSSDSESSSDSSSDFERSKKKGARSYNKLPKKRKRIKQMSQSSDNSDDDDCQIISERQEEGDTPSGKGRKNIRKLISDKKLRDETRAAAQAELERKKRIAERQKAYNHTVVEVTETGEKVTKKLILEVDVENKEELVQVHPDLIVKLKPHQVEGVKFMWECTIESIKHVSSKGSGCILAHCMGLGKTLQVIVYTHTLLTNKYTRKHIKTCLVVCPYNTILNWAQEYDTWLDKDYLKLNVFELASVKDNNRRASCLEEWTQDGGIMILSYDMFRLLVQENSKRIPKRLKTIFYETLVDPGPSVVVCDEGHILKNEASAISKATDKIKTRKRIVLTGTPLQNNLAEYHCMVQFVKPHLLGTRKEFLNRFVNPISNGQCADSTPQDVKLMKKRVHILHKLLEGCVQRCEYSSLTTVLTPRHEYVISIRLSDVQVKLYQHFLEHLARAKAGGTLGTQLFRDCCILQLICTHPYTLHIDHIRKTNKKFLVEDESDEESMSSSFIDDRSSSEIEADGDDNPKAGSSKQKDKSGNSSNDSGSEQAEKPVKIKSRERREWWSEYVNEDDGTKIELSGKMVLFFDLLKECGSIGDKVLLFSQNLLTLDLIEDLLASISQRDYDPSTINLDVVSTTWVPGIDYFRMDGSTNVDLRKRWIEIFNDEENLRARLFMISKKAGGLGTNLVGANRVIIMDASWNPSHDVQAIFRVYRFGQKKPVYIYRLLAQGTMEEKIYDRQVTKQSLSCRVIDEQLIERHFNSADLAELYTFEPDSKSKRPTPVLPKDRLLAEMLIKNKDWIVSYHEHDSLLQNISEEDLTEEERQAAWVEYEAEREGNVQNSNTASWNVLDPIIQHQPVPTPDQDPETYGPLPDARTDITKVVENLKLRRPNMQPNEMNSALLSALVMLRAHYQQCHVIAVRQKQDYMARNETAPPRLNEYLSALNVSIQQLTQVLQNIRAQQSQIHQAQQAAAGIRFRNPAWNQRMNHNQMNRMGQSGQTQAYKITLTRGPPPSGQSQNISGNQTIHTQGPRGPTTINIQLLGNSRVPLITTNNQRFPFNPSSLMGNSTRLLGNNVLFNNRTAFPYNIAGNRNVPRFTVGNGVTITPIPTQQQQSQQQNLLQHNQFQQQVPQQEPVITEAEDNETTTPRVRPLNSHTSSVTITELD